MFAASCVKLVMSTHVLGTSRECMWITYVMSKYVSAVEGAKITNTIRFIWNFYELAQGLTLPLQKLKGGVSLKKMPSLLFIRCLGFSHFP